MSGSPGALKTLDFGGPKPNEIFYADVNCASFADPGVQLPEAHLQIPQDRGETIPEGLAPDRTPVRPKHVRPKPPIGELTAAKMCQAIGAVMPEGAIISDEAQTSGLTLATHTCGAPRHDVLTITGGAIGQGLPVAVGAAVACPDRPVLALQGDGSVMYTIQSLWTMAREQLDVTVVVFNNRSYAILKIELERVGAGAAGPERNRYWILPIRTLTSCPSVTAWAFLPSASTPVRSSLPRLSRPSPNQGHTSSRLSSRAFTGPEVEGHAKRPTGAPNTSPPDGESCQAPPGAIDRAETPAAVEFSI